MSLSLVPVTFRECLAFVAAHHRHSVPPRGWRFGVGVAAEDGTLVGVAMVGRPVARMAQDGVTVEVNRVCTDGSRNACSMLYGAAWRAARALGYRRLITYTLASEGGASLRASGYRVVGEVAAASWNRPGRPRKDRHALAERLCWEVCA